MIVYSGNPSGSWMAISIEKLTEDHCRRNGVIRSIIEWALKSGRPFQLFIPGEISPYLWLRIQTLDGDFIIPGRCMGIEHLRDSNGKPVSVDDRFVQKLIVRCQRQQAKWSKDIAEGSSVRVLRGQYRSLCGRVNKINSETAQVEIAMRSRMIMLSLPLGALLNLGRRPLSYYHQ